MRWVFGREQKEILTDPPANRPAAGRPYKKIASGWTRLFRDYGAGNGIRTRDFDLGKVALYH